MTENPSSLHNDEKYLDFFCNDIKNSIDGKEEICYP